MVLDWSKKSNLTQTKYKKSNLETLPSPQEEDIAKNRHTQIIKKLSHYERRTLYAKNIHTCRSWRMPFCYANGLCTTKRLC